MVRMKNEMSEESGQLRPRYIYAVWLRSLESLGARYEVTKEPPRHRPRHRFWDSRNHQAVVEWRSCRIVAPQLMIAVIEGARMVIRPTSRTSGFVEDHSTTAAHTNVG